MTPYLLLMIALFLFFANKPIYVQYQVMSGLAQALWVPYMKYIEILFLHRT